MTRPHAGGPTGGSGAVPVLGEHTACGSQVLGKELQLSCPEVLIGGICL